MGHNRNVGHKTKVMSYSSVYKLGYKDGHKAGMEIGKIKGETVGYRKAMKQL